MDSQTSILLVGKPGHVRDALAGLIHSLPFVESTLKPEEVYLVCACDCQQAVELTRLHAPAVILIAGASLDNGACAQFLGEIQRSIPGVRCLVLTETPILQSETRFPSADAVLPIGAPFDQLQATIVGLLERA